MYAIRSYYEAMRATQQDMSMARLVGINVDRIISLTFVIVITSYSIHYTKLYEASQQYGDLKVLQQVDVQIAQRERVALVGPNGAGKSTRSE